MQSNVKKKVKSNTDSVNFLGYNATDVTGSMTYITFNGKKILLECGLHQDADVLKAYKVNSEKLKFKPSELDYIFIGHPHIDHVGLLPRLYKENCKAKIIMTHTSAVIVEALLRNCAFIVQEEARMLTKRYKREYTPLFTEDDVDVVLDFIYEYDIQNTPTKLDDTVAFQWLSNSHCVGAAQLLLTLTSDLKTKKILYTSDLGGLHTKNHFVQETQLCETFVDVAIMEATYGSDTRISKKTREFDIEHLRVAIETVTERGGSVIMPAFSFARTQELLTTLYELFAKDKNFKIPVIVDSKLTCEICDIYDEILEGDDKKLWKKVRNWENVRFITEKDNSLSCVKDHTPKIVLASSGFCVAGRILSYLQEYLKDANSMICFSGFVGDNESYLSYRIKNYKDHKTISVNRKPIANKADCITLSTFSSHATHNDLLEIGSNLNTNKLILVHGSQESKETLAKKLKPLISKNNKTYTVKVSERGMSVAL